MSRGQVQAATSGPGADDVNSTARVAARAVIAAAHTDRHAAERRERGGWAQAGARRRCRRAGGRRRQAVVAGRPRGARRVRVAELGPDGAHVRTADERLGAASATRALSRAAGTTTGAARRATRTFSARATARRTPGRFSGRATRATGRAGITVPGRATRATGRAGITVPGRATGAAARPAPRPRPPSPPLPPVPDPSLVEPEVEHAGACTAASARRTENTTGPGGLTGAGTTSLFASASIPSWMASSVSRAAVESNLRTSSLRAKNHETVADHPTEARRADQSEAPRYRKSDAGSSQESLPSGRALPACGPTRSFERPFAASFDIGCAARSRRSGSPSGSPRSCWSSPSVKPGRSAPRPSSGARRQPGVGRGRLAKRRRRAHRQPRHDLADHRGRRGHPARGAAHQAPVAADRRHACRSIHGERNWTTRFRGETPDYLAIKRWKIVRGRAVHRRRRRAVGEQGPHRADGARAAVRRGRSGRREVCAASGSSSRSSASWRPRGSPPTGATRTTGSSCPTRPRRTSCAAAGPMWLDDILCSATSRPRRSTRRSSGSSRCCASGTTSAPARRTTSTSAAPTRSIKAQMRAQRHAGAPAAQRRARSRCSSAASAS